MLVALALGLFLASEPASNPGPVSIYVGPPVQAGYADVDRALLDSIQDIRKSLLKQKAASFRIVEQESLADLRLYVLSRGKGPPQEIGTVDIPGTSIEFPGTTTTTRIAGITSTTTTPATTVTTPGTSVAVTSTMNYVVARLKIGDYERAFIGQGQDASWGKCAGIIAKDIAAWVVGNRGRIGAKN